MLDISRIHSYLEVNVKIARRLIIQQINVHYLYPLHPILLVIEYIK